MNEPIVQLEEFGVTSLNLEFKSPAQESTTNNAITFGFGIEPINPGYYKVGIQFQDEASSPSGTPLHSLKVRVTGFFRFTEGIPSEKHNEILTNNGLAMLYGALRGAMLTVSGCFPPGFKYTLPTINIAALIRDIETKAK